MKQIRQDVYDKLDKCSSLGIKSFDPIAKVYPNPTSGLLQIDLKNYQTGTIQVLNCAGKEILLKTFLNLSKIEVSTRDIPNGIYFIKITTDRIIDTRKILINND